MISLDLSIHSKNLVKDMTRAHVTDAKARSSISHRLSFVIAILIIGTAGCGVPSDDSSETVSATNSGTSMNQKMAWSPLEIIDVGSRPWDSDSPYGKTKTFFRSDDGQFRYVLFPPKWDTELHPAGTRGNFATPHYHLFHEWAYILSGDYVIHEPVSPRQRNPILHRYIEGTWLDRPAYSLHSGDWATGGVRSQNDNTMIIFEEGNTSAAIAEDGKVRTGASNTSGEYMSDEPDWRTIAFENPQITYSGSDLEWEKDDEMENRFVKWLSDDPVQGFRAKLIKIPPGWTPPEGTSKTYFKHANRLRYLLYGDMQIWSFENPAAPGTSTRVGTDYFILQRPGSIWGYGPGPVTENGAVWLDVTYAKGFTVQEEGTNPIEEPTSLP